MKRSHLRWIDWGLIAGVIVTIGLLVIPPLIYRMVVNGSLPMGWLDGFESIRAAQAFAMSAFVIVWFVFLGGCFASFLNVVAWRVPRGRSINGSSHCPKCDGKLSMRDNVPVYGWIRNGGRCRYCDASISPRYLIVEVILGLVTLLLIAIEVFAGGWNLPNVVWKPIGIVATVELDRSGILFGICALHLTLVYVLFTFSVIRSERLRLPFSIFLTAIIFGLAALFYPPLTCLGYDSAIRLIGEQPPLSFVQQALTMVIGLAVGLILGGGIDRWQLFSAASIEDAYERDLAALEREKALGRWKVAGFHSTVAIEQATAGGVESVEEKQVGYDSRKQVQLDESSEERIHESDVVNHHIVQPQQGVWHSHDSPTLTPYPRVTMIPEATACLGLIGFFLGWQAVVVCPLLFVLFVFVRSMLGQGSWLEPVSSQAFVAAIVVIVFYRWIGEGFAWFLI